MATIPWSDDRCIICLQSGDLTREHVIEDALHGDLVCKFICNTCNSRFGRTFESGAKHDPAIRSAVLGLKDSAPALVSDVEEGQKYLILTDVGTLTAKMKGGQLQGTWHQLPNGSQVAPEHLALASLRGRLRAEGLSPAEIEAAMERYAAAADGETVDLSPQWAARKLPAYLAGPDLRAPDVSDLVFVKIAYEFTALLVGRGIYARSPQLEELRAILREGRGESDAFMVERLTAKHAQPFHGITFEGNDPHSRFQVRLFGKPAYRIHLRRIALEHPPITYTHDLETGEHWHNLDAA